MIPQEIQEALADVKAKHDAYGLAVAASQEAAVRLSEAQARLADATLTQDAAKAAANASLDGLQAALETAFRAK